MRQTKGTLFLSFLFLFALLAFTTGCPNTPTPADGGGEGTVPDTTIADKKTALTCGEGTLCLHIENDKVRVCDILLKNDKDIKLPEIAFGDTALGQYKYLDSRLALSFLSQKNEPFGKAKAAVIIKVDGGVGKLSIAQSSCYDSAGKKVEKPAIAIGRL